MADFELPGYEIYERLGRGGMATVYRALHLNLDREVAIKVMDPAMSQDETFSERFIREARISARLIHPHILQIYDVNTYKGYNYIAMELLAAGDLADLINTPLPQKVMYRVMAQMTEALDYASGKGYVHRDIKPSNILLRAENDFVLADFGIARAANSGTQMTQTGLMVGTPSYMSPEQAKGLEVDGRSDLYSLAVLWYEMMTKELPYDSDSAVTIAVKHLTEPVPTLPDNLSVYQSFLEQALAKEPDERFQSGREMYEALREASLGFADDDVLTQPKEGAARKPRSNGATAVGRASAEAGTVVLDTDQTLVQAPSSSRPGRPYKLESTGQRESLVSGMHVDEVRSRAGEKSSRKSSRGGLIAALLLVALAGAGGGYYYWQQRQSGPTADLKSVTAELAAAYSAVNDNNLAAAAASFRRVLAADSGNNAAEEGLSEVETLFARTIEQALAEGNVSTAQTMITDFGAYYPTNSQLEAFQAELDQLRAQQRQVAARAEEIARLLAAAREQAEQLDFTAARSTLEEARALDPGAEGLAAAQTALAEAEAAEFERQNRWAAYTTEQRQAFEQLLQEARGALNGGELERAGELLQQAEAIAPDVPALASAQENLLAARQVAEQQEAERQSRIATLVATADAAWASAGEEPAQAPEAARLYREILAEDPGNRAARDGLDAMAAAYIEQARTEMERGDFDAAGDILETATELLPEQEQPRKLFDQLPSLAQAYEKQQAAMAKEREAAEQARERAIAAAQEGIQAAARGELDLAQQTFDSLSADYPDLDSTGILRRRLSEAYLAASRKQMEAREYEAALSLVARGQALDPDNNDWQSLSEEIELARSSSRRRLGAF